MLAQLAAQLRARQGGADAGGLGGGIVVGDDGVAIPVGDNCAVRSLQALKRNLRLTVA